MEKTDSELLIKEISSRLPYGIKVQVFGWDEEKGEVAAPLKVYSINTDGYISLEYNHYDVESVYIEDCLLYLRPMSSMTEEEKEDFYQNVLDMDIEDVRYENDGKLPLPYNQKDKFIWFENIYLDNAFAVIDWLNAHHFDYRGLIGRNLAISTEVFNPYKD